MMMTSFVLKQEPEYVTVKKQPGQLVEISSSHHRYPKHIAIVMKNPYEDDSQGNMVDVKVFLVEEQCSVITQVKASSLRAITRKDADMMLGRCKVSLFL